MLTRPGRPGGTRPSADCPHRSPQVALAEGIEVLRPRPPARSGVPRPARRARPGRGADRRLRRADPAGGAGGPAHGWVNLHFSLLPAWRGAAPVQHAIMAGDEITGASTFRLEEGLDTGPVFGVVTEHDRSHGHRRGPAGPARRVGRRTARGHARRHRGRRAGPGAAVRPTGVSLAPKLTRRGRPGALETTRRCTSTGSSAAARPPRARGPTFRGERVKLGPVRPAPTRSADLGARGAPRAEGRVSASGTATHAVRLGDVQGVGKRADAGGGLGPRRCGSSRASALADDRRPAAGAAGGTRPEPAAAQRPGRDPAGRCRGAGPARMDPPRLAALDLLRAVDLDDAYANLVWPADPGPPPADRPGRRLRHRAGLRHAALARPPRRDPRRLRGPRPRRPPARAARRAAPGRPPAAQHARR